MSELTPIKPETKLPLAPPTSPDPPTVAVTPALPDESVAEDTIVPAPGPSPATGQDKDQLMTEFWETVKRLPRYVRLATLMARDPRVPRSSKALLAAGTAYTVTPIDFVPGVIPVAGQLDDLYVLLTALRQAIRACPDEVVQKHLTATDTSLEVIDADLALVRKLVRRGVAWTIRNGRKALAGVTRYASEQLRERRSPAAGSGDL